MSEPTRAGTTTLFVAPHLDDVALSCPGALLHTTARNRAVVVTVCSHDVGPADAPGLTAAMAVRHAEETECARRGGYASLLVGVLDAPARGPEHRDFRGIVWGDGPDDGALTARIADRLALVLEQLAPSEVLAPLGVGQHIDHRLVHAACRQLERTHPATTFWYYEDRPYAWVEQATALRLRQLGFDVHVDVDVLCTSFFDARYVRTYLTDEADLAASRARLVALAASPVVRPAPLARTVRHNPLATWSLVEAHASQLGDFVGGRDDYLRAADRAARALALLTPGLEPGDGYLERHWHLPP